MWLQTKEIKNEIIQLIKNWKIRALVLSNKVTFPKDV